MAFSETTFILPKESGGDVRMRIFTPGEELPAAGHPTIGSTFALAHEGVIRPGRKEFVFELGVGPTPVSLEWSGAGRRDPRARSETVSGVQGAPRVSDDWDGDRLSFAWMTQKQPEWGPTLHGRERVAAALGLTPADLADPRLPLQQISCGVPFFFVPLATRRAIDSIVVDRAGLSRAYTEGGIAELPIFVFTTEPGSDGATAYSRMFAPGFGIGEDPATGIASGPLGCYLVRYGLVPRERALEIISMQGLKMRRPSRIHIAIAQDDAGEIGRVQVGGKAVLVGEGTLHL
jgi:trans-2,3-dihydro-3-hydroxyanthranilate isomerase